MSSNSPSSLAEKLATAISEKPDDIETKNLVRNILTMARNKDFLWQIDFAVACAKKHLDLFDLDAKYRY